jgi:pyruvate, water dikinase
LQSKNAIIRKKLGTKETKTIYSNIQDFAQAVKTVNVTLPEQQRFCIADKLVHELAQQALKIERHYQRPMDIEWAFDGLEDKLYIVQARPETVKNGYDGAILERYKLTTKGEVITSGRSVGDRIGQGSARVIIDSNDMYRMQAGEILVTDMTDPNWEPVMKRAAAIVTNRGGRTCHAAIIARELGIPAVVGCMDASKSHSNGYTTDNLMCRG